MRVEIILKEDQRSGKRSIGVVKDILTSATYHSRGIKVRLDDGRSDEFKGSLQTSSQGTFHPDVIQ